MIKRMDFSLFSEIVNLIHFSNIKGNRLEILCQGEKERKKGQKDREGLFCYLIKVCF